MLTNRFDSALAYASRLHREQRRNGGDVPYVAHLLGVASIALENGADEDQAIGALLHDAVEDQDVAVAEIGARFGPAVAAIVADCTDSHLMPRPAWRNRKEAYVDGLAVKPASSLLVSCSDKIYNAQAILIDLGLHGEALWSRFTGGREGVLWYYRALADAFSRLLPGPAARRLSALVGEIEVMAAVRA